MTSETVSPDSSGLVESIVGSAVDILKSGRLILADAIGQITRVRGTAASYEVEKPAFLFSKQESA